MERDEAGETEYRERIEHGDKREEGATRTLMQLKEITTVALFRLQANQISFSNQVFKTDCQHCYLQVIRSDLYPDITNLSALAAVVMT